MRAGFESSATSSAAEIPEACAARLMNSSEGLSFASTLVGNVDGNAAGQPTLVNYGNGVANSRSYNSDLQLSNLENGARSRAYLIRVNS